MENKFDVFGKQKIKEIKLWAWAATIIPITSLVLMFFIWYFGNETIINIAMIAGSTFMFAVAVFWWWWALHSLYSLLTIWKKTNSNMEEVMTDIKEIRSSIKDFLSNDK
jgi:hypothetical protein